VSVPAEQLEFGMAPVTSRKKRLADWEDKPARGKAMMAVFGQRKAHAHQIADFDPEDDNPIASDEEDDSENSGDDQAATEHYVDVGYVAWVAIDKRYV
jgi:hypothetical protein